MEYSVRRLGCTSWTDTNNLKKAREEKELANRTCCPGHVIVRNSDGKIME